MTSVLWFRRDLRLQDHPALAAASADGAVLGLFVVDPVLWAGARPARRAWIAASVLALAAECPLVVRYGDPVVVVPQVAAEVSARCVHLTRETTPYGLGRDSRVAGAGYESVCRSGYWTRTSASLLPVADPASAWE